MGRLRVFGEELKGGTSSRSYRLYLSADKREDSKLVVYRGEDQWSYFDHVRQLFHRKIELTAFQDWKYTSIHFFRNRANGWSTWKAEVFLSKVYYER